jgi:N-acyl-D-amino-acid deacylase
METFTIPWPTPTERNRETVDRTAVHPRVMIASDGVYTIPHPHPRGYGCFARVLGQFVRERGLLSLQEAVHKMSGFPARRFGLSDRGCIAQGMAADLVVFDPSTVAARSTWQAPLRTPVGVEWVLVNGQAVIASGTPTGRLPGEVLRRSR